MSPTNWSGSSIEAKRATYVGGGVAAAPSRIGAHAISSSGRATGCIATATSEAATSSARRWSGFAGSRYGR